MAGSGQAIGLLARYPATLDLSRGGLRRLLVRVPNWIGDAVMCEPALALLRQLFPAGDITVLAKPTIAELLRGHPGIDHTIVFQDQGIHAGWGGKWALSGQLRRGRFDLAILFQNAFEAALLSLLAGIPRRYGYATDGRSMLLSHAVTVPGMANARHHVEYYVDLLRPLGDTSGACPPRLYLSDQERQETADRLAGAGIDASDFLIGLNPGSVYGGAKRWLPERFADVADRLVTEVGSRSGRSAGVVIVGGRGEEELGRRIAAGMDSRAVVWSGQTTVRELMAVISRCGLFVTNDTGPMHVAAAFDVPVVAIFGPTDWRNTAPVGERHAVVRHPVECAPCLLRECPIDHRCMTRVTVEEVFTATANLLDPRVGRRGAEKTSRPGATAGIPSQPSGLEAQACQAIGVVFLDRDGTINEDTGYVKSPEEFRLFPGIVDAIRRLNQAGFRVVVVTNQSGVGRGYLSSTMLETIHEKLRAILRAGGAFVDGVYSCPHLPEVACGCRKPQPGLVEQATRELGLEGLPAYVVGDQRRDMDLAKRIGARAVLVTTGPDSAEAQAALQTEAVRLDCVAPGLLQAAEYILQDVRGRSTEVGRPVSSPSREVSS